MSHFSFFGRSLPNPSLRRGSAPIAAKSAARREVVATATLVAFVLSQAVLPSTFALQNAQAQSAPQRTAGASSPSASPASQAPQWFVESRRREARRREETARGLKTLLAQGAKAPGRAGGNRGGNRGGSVGAALGLEAGAGGPLASVPGQVSPSAELYVPNPYTTVVPLDLSNGRVPTQKEVSGQGAMCGALAPAAPAEPAAFEGQIDEQLRAQGFPQGLRTQLPPSQTAGLAPGVRAAVQRLEAAQKRVKAAKEANREFALTMLDWNAGHFKKAVRDMEAYTRKHPRSPWLPEALIHIADHAKFTSQPTRAQGIYQRVMEITSATPGPMSFEAHQKAYERWADLYLVEGRWAEARPMLEDLRKNDLHWRRRTWADYWLRQLAVKSSDRNELLALRNCGPLALAMVFDELGRNEAARRVAALRPAEEDGVSLAQMREIAAREGLGIKGFRARPSQLASLPLPLILHYTPLPTPQLKGSGAAKAATPAKTVTPAKKSAPGHFMIVRALDAPRGTASLINPQDGVRSTLSFAQLEREWSGAGLMLASPQKARIAPKGNWRQAAVRWLKAPAAAPQAAGQAVPVKTAPSPSARPRLASAAPDADLAASKAARVALLSEGEMHAVRGTCYVVLPQNGLGRNPANEGCNGGCPPNRGTPGVEVNQLTQNVFINDTPLWYEPAYGPSIDVMLSYNSHDASNYNGAVGNKWSLNVGSHLVEAPSDEDGWGRVTLFSADGKQVVFEPVDPLVSVPYKIVYRSQRGVYDTLRQTNYRTYTLTSPEGGVSYYGTPEGTKTSAALLLRQQDRFGHALSLSYFQTADYQVRLASVTAADGRVVRFSYDAGARLVQVSDPFERAANFSYDRYGNLVECIDMAGYAFQYSYDGMANVRQMNTPQGVWNFATTRRNPDTGAGRDSVSVIDPLLQRQKFEWEGHYAITTDARGKASEVRHENVIDTSAEDAQMGKNLGEAAIKSEKAPTGETVSYAYGANDDGTAASKTLSPVAVTDARGYTTSYVYNFKGNVTSTTDPRGNVTQVNYAANGLDALSVKNANNVTVVQATYNAQHQPTSVTTEDGTTTTTYTAWGAPESITDPLGTTTTLYNAERRVQSVSRDGVTMASFTYDGIGRLKSQTDETGLTLSYSYDSLNRVTKTFYPDNTTEETDYACCGLPGVTKDRAGRRSYYDYDALKRLVRMQDANGNTLQMDYDAEGNMTRLLDAKGHSTRWVYDASGRVTQKQYHDGKTEETSYSGGLVSASKDARGRVVSYAYDANANLTGIDYPNMADVTMLYNKLDDVTQVLDGVGLHGFTYSSTGRLTALDGPLVGDEQSFSYDSAGRLISQSVARGASGGTQSQSYSFDALERLKTLTSGAGVFTYNYAGNTGMLSRLDLPNGAKTEQSYDSLHRLTQVQNLGAAGANLASYAYGYDDRDVRTGVTSQVGDDPLKQIAYGYDAVDQLTGENATGGAANSAYSNAFQYDAMGNRTRLEKVQGGNTTLTRSTPNELNQLTALSTSQNGGTAQNSGLSYDAGGNLTQATGADGSKTLYSYDDSDRLIRIENRDAANAPTTRSEFSYDFASRKVVSQELRYVLAAWVPQSETRRVFDGLDVVQERNALNEVTAQYTRDGNIGGILARTSASGKSYFHYDGGGNVTALSDENGTLVGRYAYDAFGNTLEASGARAQENPYRFSTKEWHAASGMVDYGYRFYSPGMGRWLNRDPIEEDGGVNLYLGMGNDPINSVDEYGETPVHAVVGLGILSYRAYRLYRAYRVARAAGEAARAARLLHAARRSRDLYRHRQAAERLRVGTYNQLRRYNQRNGISGRGARAHTPHHAVQDAASSTTTGRGATINLPVQLHRQTATFCRNLDLGSGRRNLAADIRELRNLLRQGGYNRSLSNRRLQELIELNRRIGNIN